MSNSLLSITKINRQLLQAKGREAAMAAPKFTTYDNPLWTDLTDAYYTCHCLSLFHSSPLNLDNLEYVRLKTRMVNLAEANRGRAEFNRLQWSMFPLMEWGQLNNGAYAFEKRKVPGKKLSHRGV